MLRITPEVHATLGRSHRAGLVARLDGWLTQEVPGWTATPAGDRHAAVDRMAAQAEAAGMRSELDFALFVRLLVHLGAGTEAFFQTAQVREVMGWQVTNQGARLHELYRLAGADTGNRGGGRAA